MGGSAADGPGELEQPTTPPPAAIPVSTYASATRWPRPARRTYALFAQFARLEWARVLRHPRAIHYRTPQRISNGKRADVWKGPGRAFGAAREARSEERRVGKECRCRGAPDETR